MRLRSCIGITVCSALIAAGFSCVSNTPIPCETDAECDDGKLCTEDTCVDLNCRFTAITCPVGQICVPATGVCEDGECTAAEHCDDRVFCNGLELCDLATRTCETGFDPCGEDQVCDEFLRRCRDVECMVDSDCDDGDNCTTDTCEGLVCSRIELDCPSGQFCFQFTGACMVGECGSDADCDDGLFCNGPEICSFIARSCQPAPESLVPCTDDGVRCNETLQECETFRCVTSADCSPGQRCSVSGACVSN